MAGSFQSKLNKGVAKIKSRGGKTAKGKKISNPAAYVGAGLRRNGIKKYGKAGFARRQAAGRRKKS